MAQRDKRPHACVILRRCAVFCQRAVISGPRQEEGYQTVTRVNCRAHMEKPVRQGAPYGVEAVDG